MEYDIVDGIICSYRFVRCPKCDEKGRITIMGLNLEYLQVPCDNCHGASQVLVGDYTLAPEMTRYEGRRVISLPKGKYQ